MSDNDYRPGVQGNPGQTPPAYPPSYPQGQRPTNPAPQSDPQGQHPVYPNSQPLYPNNQRPMSPTPAYPNNQQPMNPTPAYPNNQRPVSPTPAYPNNQQPMNPTPAYPNNQRPLNPTPAYPNTQQPMNPAVRGVPQAQPNNGQAQQPPAAGAGSREKKGKKGVKGLIVGLIVFLVLAALGVGGFFLYTKVLRPKAEYDRATKLLSDGKYDKAYDLFKDLGDYQDSKKMAKETLLKKAEAQIEDEEFDGAIDTLEKLGNYDNASDLLCDAKIGKAGQLTDAGEYSDALALLNEAYDGTEDEELRNKSVYYQAAVWMASGDPEKAESLYAGLGSYEDSSEKKLEACYQAAELYLARNEYETAVSKFDSLGSYRDAGSRRATAFLHWANALISSNDSIPYAFLDYSPDSSEYSDLYDLVLQKLDEVDYYDLRNDLGFDEGSYGKAGKLANVLSVLPDSYEDVGSYRRVLNWFAYPGTSAFGDLFSENEDDMQTLWYSSFRYNLLRDHKVMNGFLCGYWETSSGDYYFKVVSNSSNTYSCSYNLPEIDAPSQAKYYRIRDYEMFFMDSDGNEYGSLYQFDFSDWNTVDIYCYEDGVTRRLYR